MQRSKRVASSSKVFPPNREMVRCGSHLPVQNRFSNLSTHENNEAKSFNDELEDDLFKVSAIDLESINGEPTPTSSMNLNDLNFHDLSLASISNKSKISPAMPVPRLFNLEES